MRKIFLLVVIVFGFCVGAQAQAKVGLHLGYGAEIEQPLFGINGEFHINKKISIAPDLTFYLPKRYNNVKYGLWEANANVHYYFLNVLKNRMHIFGLGGLNYSDYTNVGYSGDIGLNFGGGATYDIDEQIQLFTTLKYTAISTDQVALFTGIRFIF